MLNHFKLCVLCLHLPAGQHGKSMQGPTLRFFATCPAGQVLPGVVRADTVSSDRGMYFLTCTANTEEAKWCNVIRLCVSSFFGGGLAVLGVLLFVPCHACKQIIFRKWIIKTEPDVKLASVMLKLFMPNKDIEFNQELSDWTLLKNWMDVSSQRLVCALCSGLPSQRPVTAEAQGEFETDLWFETSEFYDELLFPVFGLFVYFVALPFEVDAAMLQNVQDAALEAAWKFWGTQAESLGALNWPTTQYSTLCIHLK